MEKKKLGCMALIMMLGALAVAVFGSGTAEASTAQCSVGYMCVWENNDYTGNFSQWPASNTGCHRHEGNPSLRSGWNRTNWRVQVGGRFTLEPGNFFALGSGTNPVTGEICWPA
jgi:hypothetical protein